MSVSFVPDEQYRRPEGAHSVSRVPGRHQLGARLLALLQA